MLDQILTQAMSHVQLITAILIFAAVALELVHIGQTRRINKRLGRAGHWLQRYLNAVFREDAYEEPVKEETDIRAGVEEHHHKEHVQLAVEQPVKSRQEENMRVSLAQKKQKKEEELLDTVLQEIFD